MNSTCPGLHMDLLPPHVKEEENGLGVLRNGVSPGRAPGERDRQITNNILLHHLLSNSRRDLVAPTQALLQIQADASVLIFPGWLARGRGRQNWAPRTPPQPQTNLCTQGEAVTSSAHTYTMPSFSA